MSRWLIGAEFALALTLSVAAPAAASARTELRGSPSSMERQHYVAQANDFTFLRTAGQIASFVERGFLVEIESSADVEVLPGVSYPYGRPELRTFITRLGAQHRAACGERLVVTSLTRPTSGQPANSHPLSVHPTGMAVDLRVLDSARCRAWLEDTLLEMEGSGLLDVTRERRPPHYHVAVFPDAYREYVAPLIARDSVLAAQAKIAAAEQARIRSELASVAAASSPIMAASDESFAERQGLEMGAGALGVLALIPMILAGLAIRLRSRRSGDAPDEALVRFAARNGAARDPRRIPPRH